MVTPERKAEIARENGRKSRGPVTELGKARASRNGLKHGLYAQHPPLLLNEDLEQYRAIHRRLFDEHEPRTGTEIMLVEQIAMGWHRLRRCWNVEAAIANLAILREQQETRYPSKICDQERRVALQDSVGVERFDRRILNREKLTLVSVLEDANYLLWNTPKSNRPKEGWDLNAEREVFGELIQEALELIPRESMPIHASSDKDPQLFENAVYLQLSRMLTGIGDCNTPVRLRLIAIEIKAICEARIAELDGVLADLEQYEKAIAQQRELALSIPESLDIQRLNRYERHVWRQLNEALDLLESMKQSRLVPPRNVVDIEAKKA